MSIVSWVAGTGGGIKYSTDGSGWNAADGVSLSGTISVAYGNTIWVATGSPGNGKNILYSIDGITWRNSTGSLINGNSICGVAYGTDANGTPLWVAVGNDVSGSEITIINSRDGIHWTDASGSLPIATSTCVAYGKDASGLPMWVAGSYEPNTLKYSHDGMTWEDVSGDTEGGDNVGSIAFGYSSEGTPLWVGVLQSGISRDIISTDGKNWFKNSTSDIVSGSSITYGDGLWLSIFPIQVGGFGYPPPIYSFTSSNWYFNNYSSYVPYITRCIAYDGSKWLAGGSEGQLLSSLDGKSWNVDISGGEQDIYSIASTRSLVPTPPQFPTGEATWVMSTESELRYSTDGSGWNDTYGAKLDDSFASVAYGNNTWVALGTPDFTRALLYSTNGVVWKNTTGSQLGGGGDYGCGIAYGTDASGNPLWVAVGDDITEGGITILTSTNGIQWSDASAGFFATGSSSYCVAYGKDADGLPLWVAGSYDTNENELKYSPDGMTWTDVGGNTEGGGGVYSIAFGYSPIGTPLWVGVLYEEYSITSTDGRNWYNSDTDPVGGGGGGYSIAYANGLWVSANSGDYSVIENTPSYSFDGKVWFTGTESFEEESVCVVYDGSKWLAGGNNGQLLSSTDGKSWNVDVSGGGKDIYFIAYTRSLLPPPPTPTPEQATWVMATESGLQYSTDGSGWKDTYGARLGGFQTHVAYGNNTWVALGEPNNNRTLIYSTNGVVWKNTTGAQLGNNASYGGGIAYGTDASGNPLWVAVATEYVSGSGITILTSPNGIQWSNASSGFFENNCSSYCVAYGKDASGLPLWVAGSKSTNELKYSPDGMTWTDVDGDTNGGGGVYSIAFGYSPAGTPLWVGVLYNDYSITSTDGRNWYESNSSNGGGGGYTVAYANGVWVAANTYGASEIEPTPSYSFDGRVWRTGTETFEENTICVAYDGSKWLAGGENGQLLSSSDGKSWNVDVSGGGEDIYSIASTRSLLPTPPPLEPVKWVMSTDSGLRFSTDGSGWYDAYGVTFLEVDLKDDWASVAYGNNTWVALGYPDDGRALLYSTDGVSWKNTTGSQLGGGGGRYSGGVAYGTDATGNPLWVAVGDAETNELTILTSPNGIHWTFATEGFFETGCNGYCVAYGKDASGLPLWVAGSNETNALKYSPDGMTWTDVGGNTEGGGGVYSITFGYSPAGTPLWVGVLWGLQFSITSMDGRNWYKSATDYGRGGGGGGYSVAYANGLWVAANTSGETDIEPTPSYSYDGISWSTGTESFEEDSICVAYDGSKWLAGGDNGQLLSSTDGKSWNVDISGGGQDIYFIASTRSLLPTPPTPPTPPSGIVNWVLAAANGLLFSIDGNNWYYSNGVTLSGWQQVAYGNNTWVALGNTQGGRALIYSTNGRVWENTTGSQLGGGGGYYGGGVAYGTDASGTPLWVAVGDDSSGITIVTSPNGIHWSDASSGFFETGCDGYFVAYGNDASGLPLWVAGSNNTNELKYSPDGMTWTDVGGDTNGGGGVYSIAFGYSPIGTPLWVGVLWDLSYSITSTDGMNWYIANTSNGGGGGYGVAYGNGVWVAANTGGYSNIYPTPAYSVTGKTWLTGDATFDKPSMCVVYNGSKWLAGGAAGQLLSSSDGKSWEVQTSILSSVLSIAPRKSVLPPPYVYPTTWVVGTDSGLQYSTEGTEWYNMSGVTLGGWPQVAYGSNKWVALGDPQDGRALLYSTNGTSWEDTTGSQLGGGGVYGSGIAYGTDENRDPLWVAVGDEFSGSGITILTSPNGIQWSDASSGFFYSGSYSYCVAYGKDASGLPLWVAGSSDTNELKYSPDGMTWTDVSGDTNGGGGVYSIAFGYSPIGTPLWVGVTNGSGYSITSMDGRNWYNANPSNGGGGGYDVAYANGVWVAANTNGNSYISPTPAYSFNGRVWLTESDTFAQESSCVAYDGTKWLAGGSEGQLLSSLDGKSWNVDISGGEQDIYSIASTRSLVPTPPQFPTGEATWVMSTDSGLRYSTDGSGWNNVYGVTLNDSFVSVAYGNNTWVALGDPHDDRALLYSTNGILWKNTTGSQLGGGGDYGCGIAYGTDASGNPLWVAVGDDISGSGITILTSTNGIQWSDASAGFFATDAYAYCVAYGKDASGVPLWVAGSNSTSALKYSPDGMTWTDVDGNTAGGGGVYSIAFGYSSDGTPLWVGVLYDMFTITSTDGRNWYNSNNDPVGGGGGGYSIAYANGLWVAANTNGNSAISPTPSYSLNGKVWRTGIESFTDSTICVAYDGSKWLAGGYDGQLLSSTDGKSWNVDVSGGGQDIYSLTSTRNLEPPPFTPPTGEATWVIATDFGLQYSTDGSGWNDAYGLSLAYNRCVAYGNNTWVVIGDPQDSRALLYSTDGILWKNTTGAQLGGGGAYGGVAYGTDANGDPLWVAVGDDLNGTTIVTSPNGISWTYATEGFFETDCDYYCVAYGKDASGLPLWVAGSVVPNELKYSTDGMNWVDVGGDTDGGSGVYSIAFGYSHVGTPLWVGVLDNQYYSITSADGKNWFNANISNGGGSGNGVAYANGVWVAANTDGESDIYPTPAYSLDGRVWFTGEETFTDSTICVAYDGSKWLAGGYNGQLLSSTDGKSWNVDVSGNADVFSIIRSIASTRSLLPPPPPPLEPVKWVMSTDSGLRYSTDGSGWYDAYGAKLDTSFAHVAYGNNIWVALGYPANNRTLLYSTDGVSWNDTTGAQLGGGGDYGGGVAYGTDASGNPLWVAVATEYVSGSGITILTSPNGIQWSNASSGFFETDAYSYCVAYGKDASGLPLWVAGSYENELKYSPDGMNWTDVGGDTNGGGVYSIAFGYSPIGTPLWVGVLSDDYSITSTDGRNWNESDSSNGGGGGYDIAYANGVWVAANSYDVSVIENTPSYSFDGRVWFTGTESFWYESVCVAYDDSKWLAGGWNGQLLSSSDGKSWNVDVSGGGEDIYSITSTRSLLPPPPTPTPEQATWVMATEYGLQYSTDGSGWKYAYGVRLENDWASVAYGNNTWVALGYPQDGRALLYSTNGSVWKNTTGSQLGGGGGVYSGGVAYGTDASGNPLWVAVGDDISGSGITILTSPNGIQWSDASAGFFDTGSEAYCVTYGKDASGVPLWVAGSYQDELKYSPDGMNWTDVSGDTNGGGGVYSIAFGYSPAGTPLWVGVLYNEYSITSTDGRNWYNSADNYYMGGGGGGYSIAYANGLWVAANTDGNTYIAPTPSYSFNGKSWLTRTESFEEDSNCVAYDGSKWLAGGENGQLLSSTDGKSWNVDVSGGGKNIYFIASTRSLLPTPPTPPPPPPSGPVKWVLAAADGLLYSTDGSGWYPSSGVTLMNSWSTVAYGNNTWVALGNPQDGRALLNSTDGRIWKDSTGFKLGGGGGYYGGGVAYGTDDGGNPMWIAVGKEDISGSGITIVFSQDGSRWFPAFEGFFEADCDAYCVAYGKDSSGLPLWVAGSSDTNALKYSPDGFTWTDVSGDTEGGGGVYSIAFGYSSDGTPLWVGVLFEEYSITSTDGRNWYNSDPSNGGGGGYGVACANGLWVAANTNGTSDIEPTPSYSYDGKKWYTGTETFTFNTNCVAYDGTTWLAGGYNGQLLASSNGGSWNPINTNISYIFSIASKRNLVPSPLPPSPVTSVIASENGLLASRDGLLWFTTEGRTFDSGYAIGVAYGDNKWVAVGDGEYTMSWSEDGITWYDVSGSPIGGGGYYAGVAYGTDASGNPHWVAVGNENSNGTSIVYSADGIFWSDGSGIFDTGSCVTFGNSTGSPLWISGGYSSGSPIKRSSDGIVWEEVDGFPLGSSVYSIAYGVDSSGNSLWNIVGRFLNTTNILWSNDGSTWNDASGAGFVAGGGFNVTYNEGKWVATGYSNGSGLCLYSLDGKTWTAAIGDIFTNYGYSIAYNNNGYIAVGKGNNNIQWSPDGFSWNSTRGVNIDSIGNGIASIYVTLPPTTTTTTQAPPPCFVTGTRVLTPKGYVPVEELQTGDFVLTADKRRVPIKMYSFTIAKATKDNAPYNIPAGSLGFRLPKNDINLSPRHAVKDYKGRWQIPKYLGTKAIQYGIGKPVTYYHIECPNFYRDNLIVEEAEVESFKNKQGSPGVLYMWDGAVGGWERLAPNAMTSVPKNPKTFMIYSY